MMNNTEIRAFDFEVRAENDEDRGDYLEGRAIVYNEPTTLFNKDIGEYQETIESGALDEADLKDVRFLINHNTDMIPLARSRNNTENSTMRMVPDEDGMMIRANLDTENNADAKSLYSATSRGDISGMSFMFVVGADRWEDIDTEMPKRYITSIKRIMEVSACTFPAYAATSLEARGLLPALDNAAASLENEKAKAKAIADKKQAIKILCEV